MWSKAPHGVFEYPRADTRKRPRMEEGQETVVASAPTPMRTDPPPSRGVRIEGSSPQKAFGEHVASNEVLRSPSNSRGSQ